MQVQTTHGSRIRTGRRSSIHVGGTAIRCGNRMTFGTAERCSRTSNRMYGQMYFSDGASSADNMTENEMPNMGGMSSALTDDGRQLYSMLSRREQRKYERLYESHMSRQQWTANDDSWTDSSVNSVSINEHPGDNAVQVKAEKNFKNAAKSTDGTGRSVVYADKKRNSKANNIGSTLSQTHYENKDMFPVRKNYREHTEQYRFGCRAGRFGRNKASKKTTGTVINATQNTVKSTTKASTQAATGVAVGAATVGVGTVVRGTTKAVTNTAKTAVMSAKKVTDKMQQQTASSLQAKEEIAVAQSKVVAEEHAQTKKASDSSVVMVFTVIGAVIMYMFVSMVSVGGVMQSQTIPETTACTKLAEAAEAELAEADMMVGGYRYKTWYGMDANWCAMFVSYCADRCGFIEADVMPKTASVAASKQWYINRNLFKSAASGYEPKAGDVIIFGNGMSHTGIVTGYDSETKTVTTIEGNSGRSNTTPYHKGSHVKEHHYPLTYAKIVGYGTPDYPEETEIQSSEQTTE